VYEKILKKKKGGGEIGNKKSNKKGSKKNSKEKMCKGKEIIGKKNEKEKKKT
jgi:hypothetical protein